MGLTDVLARLAVRATQVLIVESPGQWSTRVELEQQMRRRGWRPAWTPADADVLAVCGTPGPELAELVDRLWEQMPGPRVRTDISSPATVSSALDAVATLLLDTSHHRADAQDRPQNPEIPQDHGQMDHGGHASHEGMDHGGMDHGGHASHEGMDHGGMDHGGHASHEGMDHGGMDHGGHASHEGMDHGGMDHGGHASHEGMDHGGMDSGEGPEDHHGMDHSSHEGMNHGDHGTHGGMGHGGHSQMNHDGHEMSHGGHGGMDHSGHGDHGGMDMAPEGIPLAQGGEDRDGLEMDVLHLPLGPVLPFWPAGLVLRCSLQGDVVVDAEASVVDGGHRGAGAHGGQSGPVPAAAVRGDNAVALLALAGAEDAAARARRVRDALLRGDRDDARDAVERLHRTVRRSWLLRWSLRGVLPLTRSDLEHHGLPDRCFGDAHDRLLSLVERIRDEVGAMDPAPVEAGVVPWEMLPHLVTGVEVATVRLAVASLDLDPFPAVQEVGHG